MTPGATGSTVPYQEVVRSATELVRDVAPEDAVVAVISKGDDALLALGGRHGVHFPAGPDGRYAGFYPRDGASAVEHLEAARAGGVDHVLIPEPALWWLDHYGEFRDHLTRTGREIARRAGAGVLVSLRVPEADDRPADAGGATDPRAAALAGLLDALLPPGDPIAYLGPSALVPESPGRDIVPVTATIGPPEPLEPRAVEGAVAARWLLLVRGDEPQAWWDEAVGSLASRHRLVARQAALGTLFDVRPGASPREPEPERGDADARARLRRVAAGLLPRGARVAFPDGPDAPVDEGTDFVVLPAAESPYDDERWGRPMWSDHRCRIYAVPST